MRRLCLRITPRSVDRIRLGRHRSGRHERPTPLVFWMLRYAASSQTEQLDWVTSISSGDGDRGLSRARTSRTYRAGTSWLTILRDLADDMGIGAGNVLSLATIPEIALKRLGKGIVTSGSAADELSRLLDATGYDWSIQDGDLQVLAYGSTTSTMAVDLNSNTGLIGSPEIALRTDPRGAGKNLKRPSSNRSILSELDRC